MKPLTEQPTAAELADVPALTLLNPWALAITDYFKTVENRTWAPPANVGRIFIHAGKGWDRGGLEFLESLTREDVRPRVVRSAIVAVADVGPICYVSQSPSSHGRCECPTVWAEAGKVHWRLSKVLALPVPVPCAGSQRLWRPGRNVTDAVARSLALLGWALVCAGRPVDGRCRPVGDPHGTRFEPGPGELQTSLVARARAAGWKIGPARFNGGPPDAMCLDCGVTARSLQAQAK